MTTGRGRSIPPDVKPHAWLEYYAHHFDTVEINTSYYHMPRATVCASWRRRTPDGFTFVMKLYTGITHRRRLADCEDLLQSFLNAAGELGDKLGPVLVQLPPRWNADPGRLQRFLNICPAHLRWAVEFRDPTWLCEDVYAVLRVHNAALVVHDLIENHPDVATADWIYLRFHGPGEKRYHGSYTDAMLRPAANRIRQQLRSGRDAYAYFNNDYRCNAVRNAQRLREMVGR